MTGSEDFATANDWVKLEIRHFREVADLIRRSLVRARAGARITTLLVSSYAD